MQRLSVCLMLAVALAAVVDTFRTPPGDGQKSDYGTAEVTCAIVIARPARGTQVLTRSVSVWLAYQIAGRV